MVRLAPDESLDPRCVTAQVTLGEHPLPASQVQTVVRMESADLAQVRVLTTRPVDEPVVDVVVNAGCRNPLARRFVVLADPPVTPASIAAPAFAAAPPAVVASPADAAAPPAAMAASAGGPAPPAAMAAS
ncbi:MAG: hypothetical protein KGL50_04785, partial [Burkholderiales bacterium]|nr:hypothetical protein [Burkholderiales bacterium]